MIKLVSIDRFTKRMFHHAPVSMKFYRFGRRNPRYGGVMLDSDYLRRSTMPFVKFTAVPGNGMRNTMRGHLRVVYPSPVEPDRSCVFDQFLDMDYDDSLRVSGMVQEVRRALAENLVDQYRRTIVALRSVALFRQHNVSNWRNMA